MASDNERPSGTDDRIRNLETSIHDIHHLLVLIQQKLVGGIETDKPGIVSDLKALQAKIEVLEVEVQNIKHEYARDSSLYTIKQDVQDLKETIKSLWREIDAGKKFRWMILGGLGVIDSAVVIWDTLRK